MSVILKNTSTDLNTQVETAKTTIHEEVQAVQVNVRVRVRIRIWIRVRVRIYSSLT
jgi:hypothetical protein